MIVVENLCCSYGAVVAVDSVSFTVEPGVVTGFLGPNGAGKTTTIRAMMGLLAPVAGRILVNGIDVAEPKFDFRHNLGFLPENAPLYPEMSVAAYLGFAARVRRLANPKAAVEAVMHRVGLTNHDRHRVGALSKGYRQRVGLAQALIHDPAVVVLDEPTSGLDPNQVLEIRALIRALGERGKSVLFSSHQIVEVEAVADRVVVLNHGRLVADATLASLQASAGATVEVEVAVTDHEPDQVVAFVDALDGVESTVQLPAPAGLLRIQVRANRDVRAELASSISAHYPLVGLLTRDTDLASVFRALTHLDAP